MHFVMKKIVTPNAAVVGEVIHFRIADVEFNMHRFHDMYKDDDMGNASRILDCDLRSYARVD